MDFDLLGFAAHLGQLEVAAEVAMREGLERAARVVEAEAKSEIGHYQTAAGPFVAWAPLAPITVDQKERLGYAPPDNPLLRSGAMRASIEHTVTQGMAVVGSTSDIAVYQELGTKTVPSRSFLGAAAARKSEEVAEILGAFVTKALIGQAATGLALPIE